MEKNGGKLEESAAQSKSKNLKKKWNGKFSREMAISTQAGITAEIENTCTATVG